MIKQCFLLLFTLLRTNNEDRNKIYQVQVSVFIIKSVTLVGKQPRLNGSQEKIAITKHYANEKPRVYVSIR